MSDFQQTITSLDLLHTSLYRMELFMNAQAVKNVKTDVISLISRLEKAERERDELRTLAEEQSRLAGINAARAQIAEAELARRDAAAGEPVAYQIHSDLEGWRECTPERYTEVSSRPLVEGKHSGGWLVRKLHTAAQPAVLPPDITFESKGFVSLTSEDFAYNRALEDARKLGAQEQKVVELPGEDVYAELYRLREEIKGPDGFATWKDAAIAERVKNNSTTSTLPVEDIDYLTAMSAFHSDTWHKMGAVSAYMKGWNARNCLLPMPMNKVFWPEYRCSPDMHTKQYYETIGFNLGLDACKKAVESAGVKWEVKK